MAIRTALLAEIQKWLLRRTYGEIMTPRHRVHSYMRACAALVLGYHHLHLFDDARRKRKEWMSSSSEKTLVALPAKTKAAAATKS